MVVDSGRRLRFRYQPEGVEATLWKLGQVSAGVPVLDLEDGGGSPSGMATGRTVGRAAQNDSVPAPHPAILLVLG